MSLSECVCRAALQEEGLKRWEIGEVASRIGQVSLLPLLKLRCRRVERGGAADLAESCRKVPVALPRKL